MWFPYTCKFSPHLWNLILSCTSLIIDTLYDNEAVCHNQKDKQVFPLLCYLTLLCWTHLALLKLLREVTIIIQLIYGVLYRVWKNSMPKLLEVIGETNTKIYCRATMLDMYSCSATDHQGGSD